MVEASEPSFPVFTTRATGCTIPSEFSKATSAVPVLHPNFSNMVRKINRRFGFFNGPCIGLLFTIDLGGPHLLCRR